MGAAGHEQQRSRTPKLDFTSFILSLASSALMQLGEVPDPSGQKSSDPESAHQTIDLIGMLKEKTQGNLSAEETQLIEAVLYELRMKYVSASKINVR